MIAAGAEARDYAGHLLEIAYAFARIGRRPRGQHGAATTARRPHARRARCRAQPARAVGARAYRGAAGGRVAASAGERHVDRCGAGSGTGSTAVRTPPQQDLRRPMSDLNRLSGCAARLEAARRLVRGAAGRCPHPCRTATPGTWESVRPARKAPFICGWRSGLILRLEHTDCIALEGLTAAQLTGAGGPVQFRLRRDAGHVHLRRRRSQAALAPARSRSRRIRISPRSSPSAASPGRRPLEQYQLARHDVGFAFLDELTKQGTRSRRPPSWSAPASMACRPPICARWARSAIGSDRWRL